MVAPADRAAGAGGSAANSEQRLVAQQLAVPLQPDFVVREVEERRMLMIFSWHQFAIQFVAASFVH